MPKEVLSNVNKHAGPEARSWVVIEDSVTGVAVRPRRWDPVRRPTGCCRAGSDGHLGVSQSIRGRITDLGGSVTVRTAPGEGTEWEMKVTTA